MIGDDPIELDTHYSSSDGVSFENKYTDYSSDKGKKNDKFSYEDIITSKLESLSFIFDNIYFLKSIGLISEKNFLYVKLNNGNFGSKLWFITLLLSVRKLVKKLFKTIKIRSKYNTEVKKIIMKQDINLVNNVLIGKLNNCLQKCNSMLKDILLDLIQNFLYLILILFDILNLEKKYQKWKKLFESSSNVITILKILNIGSIKI